MLDYRNVYLKEVTDGRKRKTVDGKRGRRIKIGIAKNMKRRQYQVNAGLPGTVTDLFHRRLFFARKTEKHLHDKLKDYHTPIKNKKPGSGGSEIYTISSSQLAFLRLTLGAYSLADVFISFTLVAFICKIIYILWYI